MFSEVIMYGCRGFFFVFLVFVFSGCKKHKVMVSIPNSLDLQEKVARITEIPDAPMGYKVYYMVTSADNVSDFQIQYKPIKKKVYSLDDLKKSYLADMEILGWQSVGVFQGGNEKGGELILLFKRPSGRMCQVRIDEYEIISVTLFSK